MYNMHVCCVCSNIVCASIYCYFNVMFLIKVCQLHGLIVSLLNNCFLHNVGTHRIVHKLIWLHAGLP